MNEYANFVFKGDLSEASVCTSFVSQHLNQSAVVEIRLDSANIAEVLVNGDVINFDESLSYQFQGKYSYLKCFFYSPIAVPFTARYSNIMSYRGFCDTVTTSYSRCGGN